MGVCKYFLQGNCRYGNKCWNDHPSGGGNTQRQLTFNNYHEGGDNRGGGFQTNARPQQNLFKWVAPHLAFGTGETPSPQQQQQQSPQDIICALAREITTWESSKMWLLSCVSFEKSGPSIPGMTDMSPEELRFEAYNSQKTEHFQDYIAKVQQMHNDYSAKRQELKHPSTQLKDKLIEFIETSRKQNIAALSGPTRFSGSGAYGSSNAFGQSSVPQNGFSSGVAKVFGQSTKSLFGKPDQNQSPFQPQGSAFGGNSVQYYSNTSPQQGNVFGNNSNTGTFGPQAVPPVQNVFCNAASTFGAQQLAPGHPTNVFGATVSPSNQTNMFGNAASSGSVFGSPTTMPSTGGGTGLFGKPATLAQTSAFGQQPAQLSVFGSGMASTATDSVFGNQTASGASVFGQQPLLGTELSSTIYTPMADLTPAQLEQFQSQKFILGKIPSRPPPKELCF